ncbi:DUF484 family protein [Sphingomonas sp. HDW15A]|uniref:DUF484 family protein n=1 Tax=Sphingomonas sp. HDW15A TaxID=2714942 RepID=UPI001408B362|nr:DUF484 family protein [Sphingomonas sp. HDW15A]QIK95634.1 DUF484 family protein [Sphingomonas sp. HDW15A]
MADVGQLISFEQHTVARLRAAESARADLLAFARGHSEAVESIHCAVLQALSADAFESMCRGVVAEWPVLLGVDCAVLALTVGKEGFRIDRDGVAHLDPAICERARKGMSGAIMRTVRRGHALFGADASIVQAEALVPIGGGNKFPSGLLLLGQYSEVDPGASHGTQLLEFLGDALAAMMRRWMIETSQKIEGAQPRS